MLNALAKRMRNFIAVVGCSGGREGDNVTVDDNKMRR